MADEENLEEDSNLDVNEDKKDKDRALLRNKDLSDKLAAEAKKREKIEAESETNKKEAEFYKNFNQVSNKYQGSAEFQDKIKELHSKGYDIEDATVSVLNKEGKFVAPPQTPAPREQVAGGSATNTIQAQDDKPLEEMSLAEKRKQLMDNDNEVRSIISPKFRL